MAEISVATWNIFLNRAFPQPDRIEAIADKLFELQSRLDLSGVALQEVMALDGTHHGRQLTNKLGMDGLWVPHSRKSLGEHIGLMGHGLQGLDKRDLGHKKTAVKGYLGDTAIVSVHLRKQTGRQFPRGSEQVEQTEEILDWLSDDEKAVVMGDFNCLPFHAPRKMIERAGFRGMTDDLPINRRATVPTPEFLASLSDKDRRAVRIFGRWLNVDDIYSRGLTVVDGGYDKGDSDHYLVWGKFSGVQI